MIATPSAGEKGRSRNSLKAILGGLLASGHPTGLARWVFAYLSRSDIPLPESTKPAPRASAAHEGSPRRHKPLIWMTTTNLNPDGAPLSQFELATGLAGQGLDIRIVALADGPLRSRYEQHSIPVTIAPDLASNLSVPAWYEADVAQLAGMLRQDSPDLVVASTIDSFPVIDAARIANIPSIWNIRESEPWRVRLAGLHPLVASRALACFAYPEAVIFVARASQSAWSAFTPAERSHVIYNAPHPSLLQARGTAGLSADLTVPNGKTLIVCVGTLCERKGQIDLARALRALPADMRAHIKAAFVGRSEGDYQSKVERALGPAASVSVFPGMAANGAAVIGAAGILVHTARSEAFPRVLLEAAALGTPIIATNVDGAPERLTDQASALLYAPGDVPALLNAISTLLGDAQLREKLKAGAYHALVASHTFADMLNAYRAHIDKAIAPARHGLEPDGA